MPFTLGQSIALTTDLDADGVVDPGETVTVTLTLGTGATGGTGVQLTIDLTGLTYVGGSLNISPLALDDAFTPFGNTPFTGSSLFANDFEFFGDTFAFQSATGTGLATAQGGTITLNADGTFSYLSAAGFTGTDTFTYTITDAQGLTGQATVTFNVGPAIWYIDDSVAGPPGNGTRDNPFRSIAEFNAANTGGAGKPEAGDIIYLRRGDDGVYSSADGINLLANQQLIGQGENLTVTHPSGGAPVTLETGSALQTPTISVTGAGNQGVSLAAGNTLKGFDIATTAGTQTGIDDGGVNVGTLTISNVQVTGLGKAVDIDQGGALNVVLDRLTSTASTTEGVDLSGGLTGTFNVTDVTSAISGSTGVAFNVGAGTASIDYNGTITKTSDGRAIIVDGHTAGVVRFDGAVSSTGAADGVSLTGNTTATVTFAGLNITANSGGGAAFNATGGGFIGVTGANNTINATGVVALNVNGSTIGAAGLTFLSISANGAVNGIVLNNSGAGGFLTVTGDGSTTGGLLDRDGSGGTIQNTTDAGVLLTNAFNVTLRQLNLANTGNVAGNAAGDGVRSTGGGGIVLSGVDINTPRGHGWEAVNITGVNAFNNNSRVFNWQTTQSNGVGVTNTDTNFTSFTVDDSLFSTSATGADGFIFDANGATSGAVTVRDSLFTLIDDDGVQINNDGSGTINAIVQNNDFTTADSTGGDGNNTLFMAQSGSGVLNFLIGGPTAADGNTFTDVGRVPVLAGVLQVNAAGGAVGSSEGGRINGSIQNNVINGSTGRRGIDVAIEPSAGNDGSHRILIENNTVNNVLKQGISMTLVSVAGYSATDTNVIIRNNQLGTTSPVGTENADSGSGIEIETNIDNLSSGADLVLNVLIEGNTVVNNNSSGVGDTLDITNRGGTAGTTSIMNLTIRGNSFTNQNAAGRAFDIVSSSSGPAGTLNLDLNSAGTSPNNTTIGASTLGEFQLRQQGGVFNVEGLAGDVAAFVSSRNSGDTVTPTGAFGAAGPVPEPSSPQAFGSPPAATPQIARDPDDHTLNDSAPTPTAPMVGEPAAPPAAASVPTIDVAAIERAILSALASGQDVFALPNLPANRTLSIVYRATADLQADKFISPASVMTTVASSNAPVSQTTAVTLDTLTLSGLIWSDTDRDGVLDGGETGVGGVTVELYADTDDSGGFSAGDVLLSTITTGATVAGANYSFAGLAPGDYFVRLTGGRGAFPLSGAGELDPDNNADSDDNGYVDNGVVLSRTITLAYNTEPTNGVGNDANSTLDFALASGGTAGVDVLLGESGRDSIDGGASNDTVNGVGGDDTLNGAGGNDTLIGGTGNDSLVGGAGDDRFEVDAAGDVVVESAGEGTADVIVSTVSYTIAAHVEALRIEGTGLTGTGSAGADLLVSAGGANTLIGLGGNDVYVVNTTGDVVTEAAGGGVDVVVATVSYTRPAEVELLVLRGTGLTGTGMAGADAFRGEGGPNTFAGLGGDDVYVLGNAGDTVTEAAGGGLDRVFSTFSHTLAAEVEQLFLTGTGLTGTGNAGANLLSSAGGANTLVGLGGDDVYVVNTAADVVTEAAGEGYDLIVARHSRTIAANVEGVVVVGVGLTATGAGAGDLLISEGSGNTLTGGGGDDFLLAGTKSDALTGGLGGDAFAFRSLNGAVLADRFTVTDFDAATGDGIDLSRIDADSVTGGDQAFTIVGAFSNTAGQLVIDTSTPGLVTLRGDVNGDGVADFALAVTLAAGGTWNAGNIFL